MPKPRKALISLDSTPYYHCISRCVRRAFLCGEDSLTGKNFEHRKQWVADRLTELSSLFAIDISAYSILSNLFHVILRIDRQAVDNWSETELMERWKQLFSLPVLVSRYTLGETTTQAEIDIVHKIFADWRERLCDISWFMRCLNEHLARRANKEDSCTGRFWEGRFKSQALLDEAALLTCMGYVDLNPIRANMADTPEESDYTSIQQRIREVLNQPPSSENLPTLMPLVKQEDDKHPNAIGFTTRDYLELVDWPVERLERVSGVPFLQIYLLYCIAWDWSQMPLLTTFVATKVDLILLCWGRWIKSERPRNSSANGSSKGCVNRECSITLSFHHYFNN